MTWTLTFMLVLGITTYGASAHSALSGLAKHVKDQSDPDVAPMQGNKAVEVTFTYSTMNIADVDEEHNTVTSEGMVVANWNNGITWNLNQFNGVDHITLPDKYFWTPVMQPINTAVQMIDLSPHTINQFYNGTVVHTTVFRLNALCDVTDIHTTGATCNSKTSVWGHSKDQVHIAEIRADTSGAIPYFAGSKYDIIGGGSNTIEYTFDGKTYQIVDSSFKIRSKGCHRRRGPVQAFFSCN